MIGQHACLYMYVTPENSYEKRIKHPITLSIGNIRRKRKAFYNAYNNNGGLYVKLEFSYDSSGLQVQDEKDT